MLLRSWGRSPLTRPRCCCPRSSVLLPTVYGQVKVDVLEIGQIEIDRPSDDPGDRLHAFAHAWANDSATEVNSHQHKRSGAGRGESGTV